MKHVTPLKQLNNELAKLDEQKREDLCIALVCYLRFGMKWPIADLLDLKL